MASLSSNTKDSGAISCGQGSKIAVNQHNGSHTKQVIKERVGLSYLRESPEDTFYSQEALTWKSLGNSFEVLREERPFLTYFPNFNAAAWIVSSFRAKWRAEMPLFLVLWSQRCCLQGRPPLQGKGDAPPASPTLPLALLIGLKEAHTPCLPRSSIFRSLKKRKKNPLKPISGSKHEKRCVPWASRNQDGLRRQRDLWITAFGTGRNPDN